MVAWVYHSGRVRGKTLAEAQFTMSASRFCGRESPDVGDIVERELYHNSLAIMSRS